MKKYLLLFVCILYSVLCTPLFAKANKQVVVLSVDIHCQGCIDKIMKNIAFEKGVKDLVCDLDTRTVTVTYDANKTDVPALLEAFKKINKPATVKETVSKDPKDLNAPKDSKNRPSTDANTGASTPY